MKRRRPNHQLAKIHRNYTVAEIADLFGIHRNTVRAWIKAGLPTIDSVRPLIVHGADLADFLRARRKKSKRKCGPGEIYCVRCREPRTPAGGIVEFEPSPAGNGSLVAICAVCEAIIYRRVSAAKLEEVRAGFESAPTKAPIHIDNR